MTEQRADELRAKALSLEHTNPRRAIDMLVKVMEHYRDTWTVRNLVVDDIIRIGKDNGFWDEAMYACREAQKFKPDYRGGYAAEEKACRLLKDGRDVEAVEVRLAYTRQDYKERDLDDLSLGGTLYWFGEQFAALGEHDRAWRLYNEATVLCVKEGHAPYNIRRSMAELLLEENKPSAAVEILITGMCEANQFGQIPNTLITDLRRALRTAGFNLRTKQYRGLPDELVTTCRTQGQEQAIELYRRRREELNSAMSV